MSHPQVKQVYSAIELKLFSGIHLLLKVFRFKAFVNHSAVLRTKVQVGMILDGKYFYRCLSAINSNIDFIIDFQYNMDNKTYMAEFSNKYFYRCLNVAYIYF